MTQKKKIKNLLFRLSVSIGALIGLYIFFIGGNDFNYRLEDHEFIVTGAFGVTVSSSEVVDVRLHEQTMREINPGARRNGTSAGTIQRGLFDIGLVYVSRSTSPTIEIIRLGELNNVYLSFADPELTRSLYERLIEWSIH